MTTWQRCCKDPWHWPYWFFGCLFNFLARILGSTVVGLDELPSEGPLIFVANHPHPFDPFYIGSALFRKKARTYNLWFMAKHELFNWPFTAMLFRLLRALPIDRKQADHKSIQPWLKLIQAGQAVLIFPEGRISFRPYLGHKLAQFHEGACILARRSKTKVVPVRITYVPVVGHFLSRPCIRFGQSFSLTGCSRHQSLNLLRQKIELLND